MSYDPKIEARIREAIADPGRFVERIRDNAHQYLEPLAAWTERAVATARALHEAGYHCRAGCTTRDHRSWGDCLRAARIGVDRESLRP